MPSAYQKYKTKVVAVLNLTAEDAQAYEPVITALFQRRHSLVAAVAYMRSRIADDAAKAQREAGSTASVNQTP